MKFLLVMLSALTLNHAAQAADPICYPFEQNAGNYSKICIQYADPAALNTAGDLFVYQDDRLKYTFPVTRKYYPSRIGCFGKEHDCREIPSSLNLSGELKNADSTIQLSSLLWQAAIEKCRSGYMIFRTPEGYVEANLKCSKTWW